MIRLSKWIMWAALTLATVRSVLASTVNGYTSRYVNGVLWVVIAIGFGRFQANIIQFVCISIAMRAQNVNIICRIMTTHWHLLLFM